MPTYDKDSLLQKYPKALISTYNAFLAEYQKQATEATAAGEAKPKQTVYVPGWNDVIHLVDEKTLPYEERRRRQISRIVRMKESPSPAVAKNVVTILTAIDDIQDFTTAIGVGARIAGRISKSAEVLAKGSFTAGAMLNSLNVMNRIPYDRLTHSELKAMIKNKKIDLNKLPTYELKNLDMALKKIHPDWDMLAAHEKANWMRAKYKMTRERWGMPLKKKKHQAELNYSKGTPWGKIKIEVDKRMKRLLPTQGEMLEIAQTSDQLAGVGISFGPVVGFGLDVIFGLSGGAKFKFAKQTISPKEAEVLFKIGEEFALNVTDPLGQIKKAGDILINAVVAWATLPENAYEEFLTTAWAATQAMATTRGKEVWNAMKGIWGAIPEYQLSPGPHTSVEIIESLTLTGIDHLREEDWPGIELPRLSSMEEICTAYLPLIQKQTRIFQQKLDGTIEGDFLAACLDMIAFNTAAAISEEGAAIEETFTPELNIYTRAVDYGLEPPIYSSDEEFASWHRYIMDYVQFFDQNGPPYDLLTRAYDKFFPLSDILEN